MPLVRRPHVDLADLAGRELVAVGVEDPDLGVAEAAADAARVVQPLVAADRGEPDALGHAVGL